LQMTRRPLAPVNQEAGTACKRRPLQKVYLLQGADFLAETLYIRDKNMHFNQILMNSFDRNLQKCWRKPIIYQLPLPFLRAVCYNPASIPILLRLCIWYTEGRARFSSRAGFLQAGQGGGASALQTASGTPQSILKCGARPAGREERGRSFRWDSSAAQSRCGGRQAQLSGREPERLGRLYPLIRKT